MPARPLHPAALDPDDLLAQCRFERSRAGGPGGQNRNKVETKVTLTHTPTGVSAQAGERRTVVENKRVAITRLRLNLAIQVRLPVPAGDIASELWVSRRSPPPREKPRIDPELGIALRSRSPSAPAAGRIACSPRHPDYPALLAEALDVIAASGWDVKRAAIRLEVSMSQLLKMLRDHPPALEHVNAQRAGKGLRVLK